MYFVKFNNHNGCLSMETGNIPKFMKFESKDDALSWLFGNGYKSECIPDGIDPHNANMFCNLREKISASGYEV